MSIFEAVVTTKLPYWMLALSVLGVAATSIGVECLQKCNDRLERKEKNAEYLKWMTGFAVVGILASSGAIVYRLKG